MDALLANMLQSNASAARVAREFGVTAATDITGFGLAGHLFEMLDASGGSAASNQTGGVSAKINLSRLPLLDGFAELIGQGIRSTLDHANRELARRIIGWEEVAPVADAPGSLNSPRLREPGVYDALFDPQTSGGLLLAVRPDRADELPTALREAGTRHASMIGEVVAAPGAPAIFLE
jgi:selenide,water dikinase